MPGRMQKRKQGRNPLHRDGNDLEAVPALTRLTAAVDPTRRKKSKTLPLMTTRYAAPPKRVSVTDVLERPVRDIPAAAILTARRRRRTHPAHNWRGIAGAY